jgi:alanine-glyoxylate transaminase/serine-glyoxylate transaminase/serine-pyruvate transaminase
MATNNVLALQTSVTKLLDEGVEQRVERYRGMALRLREGLRSVGMPPYTADEFLAPVITAAYGPAGVPTSQIVQYMAEVHKIKIAGGLGAPLKDVVFRIGHMSPAVSTSEIELVIEALGLFTPQWRE